MAARSARPSSPLPRSPPGRHRLPAGLPARPPSTGPADHFRPRHQLDPDTTRAHLTYLARAFPPVTTRDIAWWHIARTTPHIRSTIGFGTGLAVGLPAVLGSGLVFGLGVGVAFGLWAGLTIGLGGTLLGELLCGLSPCLGRHEAIQRQLFSALSRSALTRPILSLAVTGMSVPGSLTIVPAAPENEAAQDHDRADG
ncbi:hypothetical protein [Nonomuraea sp. NPDC049480]|uniref:hypothetical protein n=1 Tax=Nonomuraea sp. NPDC049480 TaxID=3364353 RepID=UPI0037B1324D